MPPACPPRPKLALLISRKILSAWGRVQVLRTLSPPASRSWHAVLQDAALRRWPQPPAGPKVLEP